MKRLAKVLLVLGLGIGWAGVSAVPAGATNYLTFYYPGGTATYVCVRGTESPIASDPNKAANGCGVRVWLFQDRDYTGYSLCLSPYTITGYFQRVYRSYKMTSNTSNC
jgi:hypothetical protein